MFPRNIPVFGPEQMPDRTGETFWSYAVGRTVQLAVGFGRIKRGLKAEIVLDTEKSRRIEKRQDLNRRNEK
jgi:hypothetical protein